MLKRKAYRSEDLKQEGRNREKTVGEASKVAS